MKFAEVEENKVVNVIEAPFGYEERSKKDMRPVTAERDYHIGDTILKSGAIKKRPVAKEPAKTARQTARDEAVVRLRALHSPDIDDLLILLGHGE